MIVLVGNAQESEHRLKDYSAFIDSDKPRLVVRVSKMCNYDSGKTGTRCDWVFLNPNPMYWTFPPERRHWNVLAGASKIIVTYPPPGTVGFSGWTAANYALMRIETMLRIHENLQSLQISKIVFAHGNCRYCCKQPGSL